MAENLILYTTNGCDVCDRAKAELAAEGTQYEERNVMRWKLPITPAYSSQSAPQTCRCCPGRWSMR